MMMMMVVVVVLVVVILIMKMLLMMIIRDILKAPTLRLKASNARNTTKQTVCFETETFSNLTNSQHTMCTSTRI